MQGIDLFPYRLLFIAVIFEYDERSVKSVKTKKQKQIGFLQRSSFFYWIIPVNEAEKI
jgi:hypothetical protein